MGFILFKLHQFTGQNVKVCIMRQDRLYIPLNYHIMGFLVFAEKWLYVLLEPPDFCSL